MANNNWILGYSTTWSTASGWSLGHVPTTGEVAVFSNTFGAGSCTLNQNVVCSGIVISGSYTGNQSANGYAYYLDDSYIDDGAGGSRNFGSGMIINGSGTIHIGSTLGTTTTNSCIFYINANPVIINDDKGIIIKGIVLGNGAKATNSGAGVIEIQVTNGATGIILGDNSTFTNSVALQYDTNATCSLFSFGSNTTFNGAGQHYVNPGTATVSIPETIYTGTGAFDWAASSNCNLNMSGNVVWPGTFAIRNSNTMIFNTNNYNLTIGSLRVGSNGAGGNVTFNAGSSTIWCNTWTGSTYNTGTTNINLGSSNINCSGNFVYGTNHTVNPGTSTVNITNTSTITTNGKFFSTLGIANASGTTVTCATDILLSGNLDTLNCSGTLTFNSGIYLNGTSKSLIFRGSIATLNTNTCDINISGTGNSITDNKGGTFRSLTLGSATTLTNNGSATSTYISDTPPLNFTNGGSLTLNRQITIKPSGSIACWSAAGIPSVIVEAAFVIQPGNNNTTVSVPSGIVFSGTNRISLTTNPSALNVTYQLTGNYTSSCQLDIYAGNTNSILTFNTQNYNISCTTFAPGCDIAAGSGVLNFGSSTINISGLTNTRGAVYTTGAAILNLQSSNWICQGNWTNYSLWTVNQGTSTVNFSGSSDTTITPNAKEFYDITINKSAASCAFAANTSMRNLTISSTGGAGTGWGGSVLTCSGNVNISGTLAVNCGNGITMTGPNTTGTFGAGLGTVTGTNSVLTFNASGHVLTDNKSTVHKTLTLGANATLTNGGAVETVLQSNLPLVFTNGGTLTLNRNFKLNLTSSGPFISLLGSSPTILGASVCWMQFTTNNIIAYLPAMSLGSPSWGIRDLGAAYTGNVLNLSGDIDSTNSFAVSSSYPTSVLTFNSNGYRINTPAFSFGSTSTGSLIGNFGSGTFNVNSFSNSTSSTNDIINLQSSIWNCSGNWTFASSNTVNPGTSVVNIIPTTNTNITSNNKAFATLNFSGSNPLATGFFVGSPTISGNLGIYNGSSVNSSGLNISITSGCYITTTGNFSASGIYTIGKDLTFGSGTVLNNSAMTINLSGQAHTITTGGRNFPYTKIYDNGTWIGSGTLARLSIYAPTISNTQTWQDGQIYRFTSYTSNDWSGTDYNHQVIMRSSANGFQTTFYAPASTITQFTDYRDINNLGTEIDATDGSSTDSGNNYGINFGAAVVHPRRPHDKNDVDFFIISKTFRW